MRYVAHREKIVDVCTTLVEQLREDYEALLAAGAQPYQLEPFLNNIEVYAKFVESQKAYHNMRNWDQLDYIKDRILVH